MEIRKPIVAGQFYPGRRDLCVSEINECLQQRTVSEGLPETISAGIVPHAGWTFSGSLAAMVFAAIKRRHEKVDTFVIFGAAHRYFGTTPAVYKQGFWETPLGQVSVDEQLADSVLDTGQAVSDPQAHKSEHSIEVQVPFIQHLFGDAKILAVLVPPSRQAVSLGESVGDIISGSEQKKIVCVGSTDLTHYGPSYGFTPMGTGAAALRWADHINDGEFIDLAIKLDAEGLLASAAKNQNACGAGAAAATVAAAAKLGKTKGLLLAHTNSSEITSRKMAAVSADSVGYAAIVF